MVVGTRVSLNLKLALRVTAVALLLAVLPGWPYPFSVLLRLVVCATAVWAAFVFWDPQPKTSLVFAVVALLFNPVATVTMSRWMWAPIDVIVAVLCIAAAKRVR